MHWPLGGEQLGQASEHPSAPTSPSSSISSTAQPASLVQRDDRLPVQRPLASALEPLPRATRTVLAREAARDIGRGSRRAHASASDLTWRSTSSTCWRAPRLPGGRAPALLRPGAAHLGPPPRAATRGASRPSAWRGARVIVRDLHRAGAPMEPVCRRLLGSGVTVWSARARTARSSAASSAAPKPARRRGGMTYMRLISPMPGAMVRNLAPATGWSPSSPMREMPSGGRRSAISIGTPGSAPDIPESSATISSSRLRAGSSVTGAKADALVAHHRSKLPLAAHTPDGRAAATRVRSRGVPARTRPTCLPAPSPRPKRPTGIQRAADPSRRCRWGRSRAAAADGSSRHRH